MAEQNLPITAKNSVFEDIFSETLADTLVALIIINKEAGQLLGRLPIMLKRCESI